MKRRHKITAGVSAGLIALATAALQAWKAHEAADRVAANQSAFQCEVAVCMAQGGRWWAGECTFSAPVKERQPK